MSKRFRTYEQARYFALRLGFEVELITDTVAWLKVQGAVIGRLSLYDSSARLPWVLRISMV